jgi:hypothetical protein
MNQLRQVIAKALSVMPNPR